MNFLYQIVTSSYVYTLYEEDTHVFLHVLNLRTEKSTDIFNITKILDILNEDTEVSIHDFDEIEDILASVLSD